jgi:agmatine/peptidylarginine deiminase
MIKDIETNVVYLSDKLQVFYPDFWGRLIKLFDEFGILWKIIPGTNDIWVRDFMPIQLSEKEFLLYQYEPDYLQDCSYRKSKTDSSSACSLLGIKCRPTKMVIDGGNITLCGDYVVMTDKVFTENGKKKDDGDFIAQLENFFQKKVIIIPWHCIDPDDEYADVYGHSDGFIHWCGGNKVLMSNHREVDPEEAKEIKQIMERNGFDVREMLFDVKEQNLDWNWAYINYLQVGKKIVMPAFGIPEDKQALKYVQECNPDCEVRQIRMRDIAAKCGAMHCISWNIKE